MDVVGLLTHLRIGLFTKLRIALLTNLRKVHPPSLFHDINGFNQWSVSLWHPFLIACSFYIILALQSKIICVMCPHNVSDRGVDWSDLCKYIAVTHALGFLYLNFA